MTSMGTPLARSRTAQVCRSQWVVTAFAGAKGIRGGLFGVERDAASIASRLMWPPVIVGNSGPVASPPVSRSQARSTLTVP